MSRKSSERTGGNSQPPFPDAVEAVLDALQRLRFGAIQLTVHDGKLVQIDVTERKRFPI